MQLQNFLFLTFNLQKLKVNFSGTVIYVNIHETKDVESRHDGYTY